MGYRDLAAMIRLSPPRCGQVRVVAVDGSGGAGKSVFARRLALSLGGVPVVHTDDFASWEDPHDWWDRFEVTVLGPLARGDLVRYQAYDWAGHRFGDWQEIPASDVVIVEGVSSSRQAAVDRLTVAIWIEAPREERMTRGIARDGESMRPAWEQWIAEEDVHFARDRTRERADVIVDGAPLVPHDPEEEFVALIQRL
jgi:uridine kinase